MMAHFFVNLELMIFTVNLVSVCTLLKPTTCSKQQGRLTDLETLLASRCSQAGPLFLPPVRAETDPGLSSLLSPLARSVFEPRSAFPPARHHSLKATTTISRLASATLLRKIVPHSFGSRLRSVLVVDAVHFFSSFFYSLKPIIPRHPNSCPTLR